MKRVSSNQNSDKKKAELRKLVLMQLSKMRKKIKKENPGVLEKMRKVMDAKQNPVPVTKSDVVKIDQKKNIEAVEKMLSLKNADPNFEKAVRTMLLKQSD